MTPSARFFSVTKDLRPVFSSYECLNWRDFGLVRAPAYAREAVNETRASEEQSFSDALGSAVRLAAVMGRIFLPRSAAL